MEKSDTEAVKWYRKAADAGDATGMRMLGVMYQSGRGVKKSNIEAAKWFEKGASQGDASSMAWLGIRCANGGFDDPSSTLRVFRREAACPLHFGDE